MHDKDASGLADSLFRTKRTIGPDFEDQAVIVRDIAYTRILYRVVHALYRGEDGVDWNDTNRVVRLLVLVSRDVATATLDSHLNLELAVFVDRCNVEVRVKDLDVGITNDVGSRYLFFSLNIDADDSRLVA